MTELKTRHPDDHAFEVFDRQKFLISGGSGLIGATLVRSWEQDRIHVVRLIRGKTTPPSYGELVPWDPAAVPPIPVLSSLSGVTAAVHLSGANVAAGRWTAKYKQEIVLSRVQSARALSEALTRLKPLPHVLVCASAIGIYGDRGDEILTEASTAGTGFLAETCVEWESASRVAEEAGIRVVHCRFGVVLSPEGGALGKMLPLFRLRLGSKLGDGKAWMPWVTLRDAVATVRYCVETETLRGAVNAVSPKPVINAEFTQALAAAVRRPALVSAPAFALRLAFGEMADEALLASARVLPTKLLGAGFRFTDPELASSLRAMLRPH